MLHRGDPVQVRFQLPAGMTWPAGVQPEVYFDSDRSFVRSMRQPVNRKHGFTEPNPLGVRTVAPGLFEFRLAKQSAPIDIAVYAPGFLQTLERGPYFRSDFEKGRLEIGIEKPATLTVHFDPGKQKPESLPFETTNVIVYAKLPRFPRHSAGRRARGQTASRGYQAHRSCRRRLHDHGSHRAQSRQVVRRCTIRSRPIRPSFAIRKRSR